MSDVLLGDYVDTLKGFAFKSKWFEEVGTPIIKVTNFTDDSVSMEGVDRVSDDVAEKYRRYELLKDDVVVQTVGSWPSNPASVVGKAIRVPAKANKALLNQNAVMLKPKETLDKSYLFYLLKTGTFKSYIVGTAQGAASQASITLEAIRGFKFRYPPIEEQQKVARVLRNYDGLIENNSRRIAILETIAQNLYREWFINFRFPGNDQLSGQTIGTTEGCPEGTSAKDGASKQAQWQETAQGKIPLGWEIKAASEVIEFAPRMRLPKEGFKPFVSMPNVSTDLMLIDEIEWREGNSGTKFQNGDTLLARITPCLQNGKTAFVQFLDEEHPIGFGSTEFIVMRSKELTPEFVYCLARSEQFRGHAINSMAGADGRQRVRNDCFDSYYLAVPPKELLESFEKLAKPMFEQIFTLSKKNKNLRQQRDLLLPKLIK